MDTSGKLKALDSILKEAGQEAIDALGRDLLQLLARHGFHAPATPSTQKPTPEAPKEPPPHTDAGRVLKAIRNNRGSQTDAIKLAAEGSGRAIKIKTYRTALRRLRQRGLVRQDGDRWFPVGPKYETAA